MQYWLDAYNIIGSMPTLALSDPDKEKQFVSYIIKTSESRQYCWIVFDGQDGDVSHERHHTHTTVFTPEYQSADAYIIEKTAQCRHPDAQIVVTDDRALARAVRRNGGHVQPCTEFLANRTRQSHSRSDEKPGAPWESEVDWLCDRWDERSL